jgi:uncharacterized protein (TIGR02145 family)
MNKIIPVFLIATGLFFLSACKKDKRLPLVATSAVQAGIVTAQIAGVLYEEGDSRVTEKGICWGEQGNVSIDNNKVICTDQGSAFTAALSGLADNKSYYAKAYAINSLGVSYGREITFKTQSNILPIMTLYLTFSPGPTSADVRVYLEQSSKATYTTGLCWSTMPMPTVSNNTMMVTQITQNDPSNFANNYYSTIQNLNQTTTYYVRAFSTNGIVTLYSNEISLTTQHYVDITYLSSLTFTSASITTTISSNISGSSITAVGVCWSTNPMPTTVNSKSELMVYPGSSFTRTLSPLNAGTTYYMRSYIKAAGITYYSPQKVINTYKSTVTDIDGNSYNTVQIGSQEWMVGNLKTTRYNTGAIMQLVTSYNQWVNLTNAQTPAYCYWNYQASYNTLYGKLYPRYVAFDPAIAPVGWHVATLSEWQTLFASNIMADLWNGGTGFNGNYTGLSLSPGGKWDLGFQNFGTFGYFWAPPSLTQNNSMEVAVNSYYPNMGLNASGYSIRCVKN